MLELLIFILVLSVLILSHEFGHFIAARLSKMRVDEFGLGFPPKIFSFKKGETLYTINLIPFGGFVKIYGEDAEKESEGSLDDKDKDRKFSSRPKLAQAFVIVAGVLFNFLLAWVLISFGLMTGFPSAVTDQTEAYIKDKHVVVIGVSPASPAEQSGIKPGMSILSFIDGDNEIPVEKIEDVSSFIQNSSEEIKMKVSFGEDVSEIAVTPKKGLIGDKPAIGISMDEIGIIKLPPHLAIIEGFKRTVNLIILTVKGIYGILHDALIGKGSLESISGPIGIYNLVGEASKLGFMYLISFVAVISISLGVINLAPFPALDGGRLVILLIESIKGSPINPMVVNAINYVGFIVLIFLMILISYGDLIKLGFFS